MQFIQLSNIHKSYGKPPHTFEALKGVNLQIEQREFIALMGPSGSGKSTMANILGTLDSPTSGIYEFCGVNVCALNLKEKALLRRNYIGFIFQGFNLLPKTTALENVVPRIFAIVDLPNTQKRTFKNLYGSLRNGRIRKMV